MRTLRLKESTPGTRQEFIPDDRFRAISDSTLGAGPFIKDVDHDGFLRTANERPKASRNLVMIGGSFVESVFVDEKSRFPSIVERALDGEWRVLNAGYSGMTSLHQLMTLASKIPPYVADHGKLVIVVGQSDASALSRHGTYWDPARTITPLQPPIDLGLRLSPADSLRRIVEALCSVADALELDYGVLAGPFRDGDFSTDRPLREVYERNRPRYRRMTALRRNIQAVARDAAARHHRPFLDGQALVEPHHFYDIMHLNESGQQIFADGLVDWLQKWGVRVASPAEE